jgi:predicted phage terminase large subunit-like protein
MLFVPPRHGKSEMTTVRYPMFRLEQDPTLKVIIGAYNQTLANKFSRKGRRIAETRLTLSTDRNAAEDWETRDGGGLRAVGVGGGITGQGGNLIIIDDPVKNREEAESETYRERVWDWYTDDLYTRLEPNGAIILIMTRWHQDDLAGRILASSDSPNWTVVTLPALAEENDPLGRNVGEALCPERYDVAALNDISLVLGRSFHALYQQSPRPKEGYRFKRSWFEVVDVAPVDAQRIRYWDKGFTEDGGAYTAGVLMSKSLSGLYYVENVERGQWSSGPRDEKMKAVAKRDKDAYGRVTIWIEQEPGSTGRDSCDVLIKCLAGYIVYADKVTGDKEFRAEPFEAQAEAGNVKIVRGDWNEALLDELCDFPIGKYKDQVDASSGAFNKLALTKEVKSQEYDESIDEALSGRGV